TSNELPQPPEGVTAMYASAKAAAEALQAKHGIDPARAERCWEMWTCYFCGAKAGFWTRPRVLPMCGRCGLDESIPIVAEEPSIWRHATAEEAEEFLED